MNKLLSLVVALALVLLVSSSTNAASKMSLSVGADVLLPLGTFGDATSTGFGGSVRGQYDIDPMLSVGAEIGYFTWSGKDYTQSGISITGPGFHGVPFRVFGKYYFMPAGAMRFYGMAEIGLFFGSTGDITQPNPLYGVLPNQPQNITFSGGSSTDFNYVPVVGVEFPLGTGKTKLDASLRYDGIATSGSSSGNLGIRVGVNFPIGD